MKVLITGSNGFIGRALVSFLESVRDTEIIRVDFNESFDLSTSGWTNKLECSNVDVVVHLAQSLRYREFPDGAEDMLKVNINSTFELLEWSRLNHVNKFIFASTGNVYENKNVHLNETDLLHPDSFYSASKLSAETIVAQYKDFFHTVILRIFGVYGPGQKNMLIPSLINKIVNNETIFLAHGKGLMITPLFIDNCVEIIDFFINKYPATNKNEIFNMAGDEVVSIDDIVNYISSILEIEAIKENVDLEPKFLIGSNQKVKKVLPNQKLMSLADGLEKTLGFSQ
jgi:UDP-glucose 4-epimerase